MKREMAKDGGSITARILNEIEEKKRETTIGIPSEECSLSEQGIRI